MKYRHLGKTGLKVSEIGFGAEWLQGKTLEESKELIDYCHSEGVNFMDCWMSEPNVRTNIGIAIKDTREDWIIQGHFGSTWQDGHQIDYLDFGMVHYVDEVEDFENIMNGEFIKYVRQQKKDGVIRHIGISTHSPTVALLATEVEDIELIMFSINPAFDMLASINDIAVYIEDDTYKNKELEGLAPERAELYQVCKDKDIPLVVMKGYAGGRLLRDEDSPFGVALMQLLQSWLVQMMLRKWKMQLHMKLQAIRKRIMLQFLLMHLKTLMKVNALTVATVHHALQTSISQW